MTDEDRYLFDLHGYLVIRGVLSPAEVAELNDISDRVYPRDYADGQDSKGRRGIRHVSYVSRWDPACQRLIDHAAIVPILAEFLGPKFRIDHDYAMFMTAGSDGGTLHGLPELGTHRYFHYRDGQVRTGLTVVTFMLAPAGPGDGGFVCIPGSHKGNFPHSLPEAVRRLERVPDYVVQPVVNAGDVVLFTEALTHGTMGWRAAHERRAFLYKFNPGHMANQPAYDPADYADPSEQQRRIMAAPSVGQRPDVVTDG
jgi:hypothetical protein